MLDFEGFKNSDKGRKLVAWILQSYSRCKSDRLTPQRQWDINLEMFKGRQWVAIMGQGNEQRIVTPPAPAHRVRATTNLIRPMIRMEIARLTEQQPTAYVVPSSSNETAVFAAQGGETVWRSITERKDWQTKIMGKAAFWVSITGNAFLKEFWNPTLTDPANLKENPQGPDLEPVPAIGDVDLGVVKPYNLFVPDLSLEDIEDQPYVIEAYMKPIEWCKKFFKGMISLDMQPNTGAREEIEPRTLNSRMNQSAIPQSVLVLEIYIKPGGCEYFPEGGMCTLVGNELAQVAQTFPFSHGEYPYAHLGHVPSGEFYRDSVLVDINPLQREYNGTRSAIIENKRLMAQLQLLVPKGSVQLNKWIARPGAMLEYIAGIGKPEPLPIESLPAYVLQELDVIKSDMDDISGQHAPSRGMAPGQGVTAATAIAFLQEKDDNLMSPTYDSWEAGNQKIARHTLIDVQERWDDKRIVRVTGMDGAFDAISLKGAEISTDIKIESGSALPESRAARQAFLMELFQNQAIDAPQLLDLLDMGGLQKLTAQIRIDTDQARRENLRMKQLTPDDINMYNQQQMMQQQMGTQEQGPNGQPLFTDNNPAMFPPMVEVHDYDNHQVHIVTHNNYRKSQEFETLDPAVQAEFQRHIALHQAQLYVAAQTQAGTLDMGGGQQPDATGAIGGGPDPSMQDPSSGGAPPQDPSAMSADPTQPPQQPPAPGGGM